MTSFSTSSATPTVATATANALVTTPATSNIPHAASGAQRTVASVGSVIALAVLALL